MTPYSLGDKPLVVGRTPALPLRDIFEIFRAADPLEALRVQLRDDAFVRSAVAIASPSLYAAMCDWLENRPLKNTAAPLRLLAYIARMSTRPTPFGFFASIGEVQIGTGTTIALGDGGTRLAQARPDMGWLLPLAQEVEEDSARRLALRVTLNPLIVERADRLHVMNPMNVRHEEKEARLIEHTPISLKNTQAVDFVINILRQPMPLLDIARALAERFGAEPNQAEKLVDQLWNAGLFISELRPNPCADPTRTLGSRLVEIHPRGAEIREALECAEALNGTPVHEISAERYAGVVSALRSIHDTKSTVQIDSTHGFTGTLGKQVLEDVLHLADTYVRCSRKMSLHAYREAFARRYEGSDRLVPLLELVNSDFGLGSPAEPETLEGDASASRGEELVDLATHAFAAGERAIQLDDAAYERFCPASLQNEAPARFEIGFQVAARSREAVERGEYLVVPSNLMAAIGAGRSVGRFASALGEEIGDRLGRFARSELPDRIVAEMTFMPPSLRSLNVAQRRNPYAYEVPIGVMPGDGETISPADILVGVRHDRFFLYSKRLDREVTVRESHVFNTSAGAPEICRFLSFVERDGARTFIGFDWGDANRLPVLPRLVHGRVVLSPMSWRAPKALFDGRADEIPDAVATWRARWNLPNLAYLRDNDQWLPIDFTCALALEMLRDQLKRSTETSLQFCEVLPGEDEMWMTSGDARKRYVTEFVASIATTARPRAEIASIVRGDETNRQLGPDSEWLYVKLYCGSGLLDALIARHIGPLITDLYKSETVDRAFFLRYGDPDSHLRLRLRRTPMTPRGDLFERVASACGDLLATRMLERYSFDTYERELERYGGLANIDDVEAVFSEDSSGCLASITGGVRTQYRKITDALLSMRWLLDGLLGPDEYAQFLEHRGRPQRKLTSEDWTIAKAVRAEYIAVPKERVALLVRISERLANATDERYYLLDSLLHMHCNRLGLDRVAEVRTMEILWHVCSGVLAQQSAKAPSLTT